MAAADNTTDRITFAVSVTPIEVLVDENSGNHSVIASEVGRTLGGSGNSLPVTAFNGTAANQGFLNATVNYKNATHSAGGTEVSATDTPDFIYIKNTGFKFSSATALGASTTDCVLVVIKEQAYSNGEVGGYVDADGNGKAHYYEVGWLSPGQAMVLPCGGANCGNVITQFGAAAGDCSPIEYASAPTVTLPQIYVRTYLSDGQAAASGNAIEYLVVT